MLSTRMSTTFFSYRPVSPALWGVISTFGSAQNGEFGRQRLVMEAVERRGADASVGERREKRCLVDHLSRARH